MNSPSQLPKIKEAKKSICSRILTPKQVGPICWFMATFVAMFYSQRSRKLLLDASSGWNNKKALYGLLKHVLDDKYLKTLDGRDSEDYKKFSDNTFFSILIYLHLEDSKKFPYNPKKEKGGFNPDFYIGKLYKLLNVDYKIFNYYKEDNSLTYSYLNEEYDWINYTVVNNKLVIGVKDNIKIERHVENNYAPPILLVKVDDGKGLFNFLNINEGDTKENLTSMKEQIFYNGKEYNLDAVILTNWNINKNNGHAIAGISCKKGKYVYNGWTRTSMDPVMKNQSIDSDIPCELMKYDWNIVKNNDFCLNTRKCIPELLRKKLKVRDICFNFSKGGRLLIYVRKDAKADTSAESDDTANAANVAKSLTPPKSPKKPRQPRQPPKNPNEPKVCPEGKVLNPRTNRCILIKNVNKPYKQPKSPKSPKQPKVCPEGKVLNPRTNRCILIKPPKPAIKVCPEGKVLNPKTGRCILTKNIKK